MPRSPRLRTAFVATLMVSAASRAQTSSGVGGGGTIFSLVYTSSGVLFAGCDMSGIYRSADNGNSWFLLNQRDVESPDGHFSVAVDPVNANHLFAVHPRQGVEESTSGGANGLWTKYAPGVIYDPDVVGTVLSAAVSGGSPPTILLGSVSGVYGIQGSSWQRRGSLTLPVLKILFVSDPAQPSGQHAYAAAFAGCSPQTTTCTANDGVYDLAGASPVLVKPLPSITDLAGANIDASNYVLYAAAKSAVISRFSTTTGWQDLPTGDACIVPNLLGLSPRL
jgi:hypothetical protein